MSTQLSIILCPQGQSESELVLEAAEVTNSKIIEVSGQELQDNMLLQFAEVMNGSKNIKTTWQLNVGWVASLISEDIVVSRIQDNGQVSKKNTHARSLIQYPLVETETEQPLFSGQFAQALVNYAKDIKDMQMPVTSSQVKLVSGKSYSPSPNWGEEGCILINLSFQKDSNGITHLCWSNDGALDNRNWQSVEADSIAFNENINPHIEFIGQIQLVKLGRVASISTGAAKNSKLAALVGKFTPVKTEDMSWNDKAFNTVENTYVPDPEAEAEAESIETSVPSMPNNKRTKKQQGNGVVAATKRKARRPMAIDF